MTILIIEDDILLLKTLEFKLKKEAYEIITAKNGVEGMDIIKTNMPDLIVTDIMMPFVNGLELIGFLRNDLKSNIPVIVLSSAKHQQVVNDALELGADDFLAKPFNPEILLNKIQTLKIKYKAA